MLNMSHCRFQNTNRALEECLEALREEAIENKDDLFAAKKMLRTFLAFCTLYGIVQEYDAAFIDKFCDSCYKEVEE